MLTLPEGVVTFLFTDVEGSTRLWEDAPDTMMAALSTHDRAIEDAAIAHDGVPVRPRGEGDSRFVVFSDPADAVAAAADMQRALAAVEWPTPRPIRVRAALHTGDADLRLGDYYGSAVNRTARLRAIGHGGQTLVSGATRELVHDRLPDGVTIVDMGLHRLKDLTRPEHVYQLELAGLNTVFPPLTSLDVVPNNLPVQLTDFVGRAEELAETKRLLGATRLLTILAPGGSGKTRLAIQAAADLTADYEDGVFFIDLVPVAAPGAMVQAVAESLGLGLSSGDDVEMQLLAYLASRNQLLIFDNFEHLLEGAALLTAILGAAPEVRVMTTSRAALKLTGETVLVLEGLESTWESAEQALETSGVDLFIDAARRARPGFVLRPDDLAPLSEILRLTDGMPLGIVLAAAWAAMLSVDEIAAEIATSLDFLEADAGDVPDRQRSVRAVFDHTWDTLSPDEQRIFAALSVFRGGFTRDAAEAVAGASLRQLGALAGKALVSADPDAGRYTIHELLRQYAEAELAADPEQSARILDAHAGYYTGLAGDAFPLMTREAELTMLEADIENVRLAWRRSIATGNAAGVRNLVGPLWAVYEVRGWYPSAVSLFEEALDGLEDSGDDAATGARALTSAAHAWFLALQGRPVEAEAATDKATDTLRALGDREALWLALACRALTMAYTGQDWTALADEGIALGQSLDGPFWAAVFKNWRGGAALYAGELDFGRSILVEGMEVYRQVDEDYWHSANLQHQAQIATADGRTDDAVDLYGRSTEKARQIGALRVLQMSAAGLGDANLAAGDNAAAEAAYLESMVTSEQMSMRREMLSLITKIAKIDAATGQDRSAVELLSSVLADPLSEQQAIFDPAPIVDIATAALGELEASMDPAEFTAAKDAGTAMPYDVTAKELIGRASVGEPL